MEPRRKRRRGDGIHNPQRRSGDREVVVNITPDLLNAIRNKDISNKFHNCHLEYLMSLSHYLTIVYDSNFILVFPVVSG